MRSQSRTGFTLIELMVAMALTMFLMVILTQCFVLSLETFAGMKGIGDMQQNLRTATVVLQSDLSADKFEGERRLSDPSIADPMYPIQAGFMVVQQGSLVKSFVPPVPQPPNPTPVPPLPASYYYQEGIDPNGVPSSLVNNHMFYLTVKRKGNRPESFFTAALTSQSAAPHAELASFFNFQTAYNMLPVPNAGAVTPDLANATLTTPYAGGPIGFYASQWAEVFYYLVRIGTTEEPNNPTSVIGTPTYSLYRAQFVMVPDSVNVNNQIRNQFLNVAANPPVTTFAALACNPSAAPAPNNKLIFYSPMDAATAGGIKRTLGAAPINAANPRLLTGLAEGATLVLPNVLSFQVQIMPSVPAWNGTRTYAVGNLVTRPAPPWDNATPYPFGAFVSYLGNIYICITPNTNRMPTNAAFWRLEPPFSCIAGNTGFMPPNPNYWAASAITGADFIDVPSSGTTGTVYDTTLFNAVPSAYSNNFGLKAIKVTMRVWDNATRQTRQATVMQDF